MKTIFISSFHPYISRNILATDAFSILVAEPNVRIVLFTFEYKKDYFQKKFGHSNVIIEGIQLPPPSKKFFSLVMKRLAKFGLDSHSVSIERRIKLEREGKFFYFIFATIIAKFFTNIRLLRTIMRAIDFRVAAPYRFSEYFVRYKPDVVLITDIQNERDVELAHNARYFKIPSIGMVRSWDNLTTHGILRVVPDKLLAPSARVKEQAIKINDVPAERVEVVGISHYDKYAKGPKISREEFFALYDLPIEKKLIFCTVIGDVYIPNNTTDPYVLKLLSSLDVNIIVRFSPTVKVSALDGVKPYPNMRFDRPGVSFFDSKIDDQELGDKDDDNLMHGIYYSDLVVCGPSTIVLDAAFFNKPIVLTGAFHPYKRKYLEGEHRYDYSHFLPFIACGAGKLPRSSDEFLKAIEKRLKNPALDAEGQECFRRVYCNFRDGKAGERIARAVLALIA